ncbi:MAG: hypothetical protein U1F00_18790 [Rhodoferax sp.]
MPIAGGEVLTRRQTFQPWLVKGAFDIVQPDGQGRRHQRAAPHRLDGARLRRQVHRPRLEHRAGPGRRPATGQRLPDTDLVEYIGGSPYVDGILREPFVVDSEGYPAIPDTPGLGMALDPEKVALHAGRPPAVPGLSRHVRLLKRRVLLVTGAGGGIGSATAAYFRLRRAGDDRRHQRDRSHQSSRARSTRPASGCRPCATTPVAADAQALVDACMQQFGRLDYLVPAAAITRTSWCAR